ncbi:hypothetical protein F5X96DRAFT_580834 [Biscogniauxia mediterranea]|nr:hypothetical protein F5X96DRAFT_580834 [Biscogniauxia mediterranea]
MDMTTQIRLGLQNQGLPSPSLSWIQSAMPTRNPLPPLPALTATVKTRFLATDLTHPGLLEPSAPALPPNLANPEAKEVHLSQDVLVQVLDIDNLSKSKWEQVEELEAIARGEQTRGREIIRLPTGNDEDEGFGDTQSVAASERPATAAAAGRGGGASAAAAQVTSASKYSTHRLVLQDRTGQKIYGLELKRIERIGISTLNIGEKLLLKRGATVARGTVLLEPATCVILGGKVEAWNKAWMEGRLARLREAVGADSRN